MPAVSDLDARRTSICSSMKRASSTAIMLILIVAALASCGLIPRKVAMDNPRVQQLVKAAQSFDRTAYGFSPIPKQADVRLELRPTGRYDAMLHITTRTVRTIAFRKENGNYVWIGEQETFDGPKTYKTRMALSTKRLPSRTRLRAYRDIP